MAAAQSDNDSGMKVVGGAWEDLHKRARKLESLMFYKLAELGKLSVKVSKMSSTTMLSSSSLQRSGNEEKSNAASAAASTSSSSNSSSSSKDKNPGISALVEQFDGLQKDINALLKQLSEIHDSMSSHIKAEQESGMATSDQAAYILHRGRQVFQDSLLDFRKQKECISNNLNKLQMFEGQTASSPVDGMRGRTDTLLKEKDGLQSSIRQIDDLVQQSVVSRESLDRQRSMFENVTGTLSSLAAKFPQVNNLIGKIKKHKHRDMIVLSAVIAFCMCFTVLYTMNKY